jgi:hypothetical protein
LTYSVNITATNQVVNVTNTSTNVVVSDSGTIIFTVTTTSTNVVVSSTSTNVNAYYDAVELRLADLNTYWKGVWTTSTYNMGDLVNYRDSVFLLKDFSADVTAVYTSTIVPPSDTTYWTRIVWHEAPFDHVTVTNALVVGGSTTLGGTLGVTGNTTLSGNLTVANTATIGQDLSVSGGLSVGAITGSSGITASGPLRVGGTSTFVGTATFLNDVNMGGLGSLTTNNLKVNNSLTATQITVSDTLQTTNFKLNGLQYPTISGLYGQVLTTNGYSYIPGVTTGTAQWRNLGDLVYWSLSNDLYTNGFNIITNDVNQKLKVGVATAGTAPTKSFVEFSEVDLNFAYPSPYAKLYGKGSVSLASEDMALYMFHNTGTTINYALNLVPERNYVILQTGLIGGNGDYSTTLRFDNSNFPYITNEIESLYNPLKIFAYNTLTLTLSNSPTGITMNYLSGMTLTNVTKLAFSDGSIQTTAFTGTSGTYSLPIASASTLGGIKVGTNLSIDGSGILSANTGSSYTLPTATTSVLGGVKIDGTTITINGSGVISSVNTNTYTLNTATASVLGGIKVGNYLSIDGGGVLSVNTASLGTIAYTLTTATSSALGGVRIGSGVNISANGTISVTPYTLPTASAGTLGGIKIGSGLDIDGGGVVSVNGYSTTGYVSLTATMYTNALPIAWNSAHTGTNLTIGQPGIGQPRIYLTDDYNGAGVGTSTRYINFDDNSIKLSANSWTYGNAYDTYIKLKSYPSAGNDRMDLFSTNIYINANGGSVDIGQNGRTTIHSDAFEVYSTSTNITAYGGPISFIGNIDFYSNRINFLNTGTSTVFVATQEIDLRAPLVKIGTDIYNSQLNVNKIYNFNGTYAPKFPAGIQYNDETVQITAFRGYDQGTL